MKLNKERLSRYLVKIKHITNYVRKMTHKDRQIMMYLTQIQNDLFKLEDRIRELKQKVD